MQNVPYYLEDKSLDLKLNLKELFLPDTEDQEIYDLDIRNAEMRILCAYSGDATLIKAFKEGMDLHSLTASGISDFSYEEICAHKEEKSSEYYRVRQIGKKVSNLAFSKAA